MTNLILKLKSVTHSGSHIGRDIILRFLATNPSINFEIKKNILPEKTTLIDKEVYTTITESERFDIPLTVTVIERDALFNDKGSLYQRLYIDTNKTNISEHVVSVKVYENRFWFWRKPAWFDVLFEVRVEKEKNTSHSLLKQYTYRGVRGDEDYNRYDELIVEVVNYWNKQFSSDASPPKELLDPNLVKAMIYQETRMGYTEDPYGKNADIDIMQTAYSSDPAIPVLRAEVPEDEFEYWIYKGEKILLNYPEAKVDTPKESIFWGVRWLYHKAHKNILDDNGEWSNGWNSWYETIRKYGPSQEYQENVWGIYKEGVNKNDKGIKLWSFSGWLLVAFLFSVFNFGAITNVAIRESFATQFPYRYAEYREEIVIEKSKDDSRLFVAYEDDGENWSEFFAVGRVIGTKIKWLDRIEKTEDPIFGIYSARFLSLQGIEEPVLEIWLPTHRGGGMLRLYKILEDDSLELIINVSAIDRYQNEADPSNYGQNNAEYLSCGAVYGGEEKHLHVSYKDMNRDGIDDVVLNGIEVISCERMVGHDEKGYIQTEFDEIDRRLIDEKIYYLN